MTLNSDIKKILHIFHTIKEELEETSSLPKTLSLIEAKEQLSVREEQLTTVLEISEKLIYQFTSLPQHHRSRDDLSDISDLKSKYNSLQKLYDFALENLDTCKYEIKSLQDELHTMSKSPDNNLFSLEVYQSELEDTKKHYKKKVEELQSKKNIEEVHCLQSTSLQIDFLDLRRKHLDLKCLLASYQKKIGELEEIINVNNEQKKMTEMKYNELVETHKKMFGYIEKLEVKVKRFQKNNQRRKSCAFGLMSNENSLTMQMRTHDEMKTELLSVTGPINVFTV
jgi:chromosome segregation ATPase